MSTQLLITQIQPRDDGKRQVVFINGEQKQDLSLVQELIVLEDEDNFEIRALNADE